MITVTHEEIRDKMFFIRDEDNDSFPVAVIKVSDLLNLAKPQDEWNEHKVACLLAELFNDSCACNYFGTDEWLPECCDLEGDCFRKNNDVACWEQFLKHYERKPK